MDIYGTFARLRALYSLSESSARQTGRTTRMLRALTGRETVVCTQGSVRHNDQTHRQMHHSDEMRRVRFTVCSTHLGDLARAHRDRSRDSMLVLSHEWVEQYYLDEFLQAEKRLRHFMDEMNRNVGPEVPGPTALYNPGPDAGSRGADWIGPKMGDLKS